MRNGKRLAPSPKIGDIRQRARDLVGGLPEQVRRLREAAPYPVEISADLRELEVDERQKRTRLG